MVTLWWKNFRFVLFKKNPENDENGSISALMGSIQKCPRTPNPLLRGGEVLGSTHFSLWQVCIEFLPWRYKSSALQKQVCNKCNDSYVISELLRHFSLMSKILFCVTFLHNLLCCSISIGSEANTVLKWYSDSTQN